CILYYLLSRVPTVLSSSPTRRSSVLQHRLARLRLLNRYPHAAGRQLGRLAGAVPSQGGGGRGGDEGGAPGGRDHRRGARRTARLDRKSTRLHSNHVKISYAVFCLKKR